MTPGMSAAFRDRLTEGRAIRGFARFNDERPDDPLLEALFAFEYDHRHLPRRERAAAVRAKLGISETRYVVLLNRSLDNPRAMEMFPEQTDRLRTARDASRRRRELLTAAALRGELRK